MTSAKRFRSFNHNKQIDRLKRRFEEWRKCRKPRTRIPKRLWESAVQVAVQCGLNRTARTLHLDYYSLKKKLEASSDSRVPAPAFIELSPGAVGSTSECIIECENPNGAKMRIHIKGVEMPDLDALSNAFWRCKP